MILFASDFDGTLHLPEIEGNYRKEDLEAIRRFQDKGNMFGLCTGRAGNGFGNCLDGGPSMDFWIVSTGALIMDKDKHMLYEERIPTDFIYDLDELVGEDGNIYVHADGNIYTYFYKRPFYDYQTVLEDIDMLEGKHIHGVSVQTDSDEQGAALTKRLNESFMVDLVAYQNRAWLDVVRTGVSKGKAARKAKELFGAELLVGIGDAHNDMELIRQADVSFTFPYAPQEVQDAADHVVESIAEAIAYLEEHYM